MSGKFLWTGVACGALIALMAASSPAAAYIGPGLGLGVIASIIGAIAAFFMMIAGLVWYPIKIMLRKRKEKKALSAENAAGLQEQKPDAPTQ